MDHSSVIYVMGPGGQLAGLLDDGMKPADMAERLRKLGV
jgi:cytochrome oxidase Cu insertion factor (SCO1/SenC/PrrC family)